MAESTRGGQIFPNHFYFLPTQLNFKNRRSLFVSGAFDGEMWQVEKDISHAISTLGDF